MEHAVLEIEVDGSGRFRYDLFTPRKHRLLSFAGKRGTFDMAGRSVKEIAADITEEQARYEYRILSWSVLESPRGTLA
jgi:hypothetical protein